jgi:hypothetical protein
MMLELWSNIDRNSNITRFKWHRYPQPTSLSTDASPGIASGLCAPQAECVQPIDIPRVLTPTLAGGCGVSRARIRTEIQRGRWRSLGRGLVLTRPDPPSRADWVLAGLLIAGPEASLSGWDAVRMVGIGERAPPHRPVLVLTTHGGSRRVGQVWIRKVVPPLASRLSAAEDPILPLVRVVPIARALVDTALADGRVQPVRALVTSAIQRELCSIEELRVQLRLAPRRGSAVLRRALSDAIGGARSAAEADAADRLRAYGVPAFELNVPIVYDNEVIAVADMLWRELRAVLEIDSREFHFSEGDWKATTVRHNRLTTVGLALTHYPPSAIRGTSWAAEVAKWLRRRADELGLPYRPGKIAPRAREPARVTIGEALPFVIREAPCASERVPLTARTSWDARKT